MSISVIHPRRRRAAPTGRVGAVALAGVMAELPTTIRLWIARSRQRAALRELAQCSDRDHLLGDIGVTPGQARHACAKWFWQP